MTEEPNLSPVVIQKLIREAFQEGFEEGAERTVQITTHAEPYETSSEVSCKYTAKGEPQPEVTVKIIRHLQDEKVICDTVHADLMRGVDEVMIAVREMFAKHQGVK